MKPILQALLALSSLALVPACSGEEVEAKMSQAKTAAQGALDDLANVDFSALSTEALKAQYAEVTSAIATQLESVKDVATAENVKAKLEPAVEALGQMKTMLGENMPSMESIQTAVADFKTKFANNPAVLDVLKSLIEKIQSFFA